MDASELGASGLDTLNRSRILHRDVIEVPGKEMRARMADDAKAFVPRSVQGRQRLARGRYAGRLMHTFAHQVPEQHALDAVMKHVQTDLDLVTIGKTWWLTKEIARQRREDGGIGHLHLPNHMSAVWAHELRRCLDPEPRPWKNSMPCATPSTMSM